MALTSPKSQRGRSRRRPQAELNQPRLRSALKMAILESGRSQLHLAAVTGIHDTRISKIVRGWVSPSDAERAKLSAALGRGRSELFPRSAGTRQINASHH